MATHARVTIAVADYDLAWPRLYAGEASALRQALGARMLRLEHVGSTSVPGLAAKPTLDILLAVADSRDEVAYTPGLEAAGYAFRLREPRWHEHRLFVRAQPGARGLGASGDPESGRAQAGSAAEPRWGPRQLNVNLHVFSRDCPECERMLRFRDWLRGHADDRELYQRTKRALAQKTWESVDDYAAAKTAVVEAILARAGGG